MNHLLRYQSEALTVIDVYQLDTGLFSVVKTRVGEHPEVQRTTTPKETVIRLMIALEVEKTAFRRVYTHGQAVKVLGIIPRFQITPEEVMVSREDLDTEESAADD